MALPNKIEFTGGFSIVPNSAGAGAGEYYLLTGGGGYNPGLNSGTITFPNHTTNLGIADPNLIISDASLYINLIDTNGVDRTTILTSMTTNNGTIRLSQSVYHIEFSFTPGAFRIFNGFGPDVSIYWDDKVGPPPTGTLSVSSTSGYTFNNVDPITISISI
jgi:hypothetical protein